MDRNEIARRAFAQGQRMNGAGRILSPGQPAKEGEGPGNASVAIGISSADQVDANFCMALAAMQYMVGRMGLGFFLFAMKGDVPAVNRNGAAKLAIEHKCEWLLLLDGKVTFPPNGLARLVNSAIQHKFDVVGATVAQRVPPHANMATALAQEVASIDQFVEIHTLPAVFLLINVPKLVAMKQPYFRYETIEDGQENGPLVVDDAEYFCKAARAAGLKVWLDVWLSTQVVSWGECGYRLTGTDDPNAPAFERVELGSTPSKPQELAANESKYEDQNGQRTN